jgi:hypothetical protein
MSPAGFDVIDLDIEVETDLGELWLGYALEGEPRC